MSWIDPSQYDPNDICPICHDNYGTNQAIYKTKCNHMFHNDCLNVYCETYEGEVVCPVCRSDIEYGCMDVWAFKEKALDNASGAPLFNGNEHILAIYNDNQGGRRRKNKRNKSKRNKRTNKKRRSNKKRRTNRRRR